MKYVITVISFFFLSGCNGQIQKTTPAMPSDAELHSLSFTSIFDNNERDFFVYLPKGYYTDSLKEWPVIFHLHGNGARGNGKEDLIWVTKHGPLMEAWVQKRDLPFIIVVPQLQMMGMDTIKSYIANRDTSTIPRRQLIGVPNRIKMDWIDGDKGEVTKLCADRNAHTIPKNKNLPYPKTGNQRGWNLIEDDLMAVLERVQKNYRANSKQTYLTGISYGAFGAWYLSSTHINTFAAIAPVSGWGHPDLMPSIASQKLPIWCFSGCQDNIISTEDFYPGLQKLNDLGLKYKFTVEPNAGHDVWKKVFEGEDLYEWLLQFSL